MLRNEGLDRLVTIDPSVRFVQFVDGDCEVVGDWLERASRVLDEQPDVAVVCGRRRERYPEQTIYNRLADLEWDSPVGEAKACGGDALMRLAAVREVGGYNPAIIAAEDDEVCLRMRAKGWRVLRIDAEMTLHDMAMTRFQQWWKRSVRTGHAYAEGSSMYGRTSERHFVRQTRSTIFWGIAAPILGLGLAWPTWGASLLALAGGYLFLYRRTRALLRGPARLAAGRRPALCVLDRSGQVPTRLRPGAVLGGSSSWQAQPRDRLSRTRTAAEIDGGMIGR